MDSALDLNSQEWGALTTFGTYSWDLPDLIRRVKEEKKFGSGSIFSVLLDRIYQQFSCVAATYAVVPHLVDIGEMIPDEEGAELWYWIGAIAASYNLNQDNPPHFLVAAFKAAILRAEQHCIYALATKACEEVEAYDLIVAALGLAGHPLGNLIMDHFSPVDDAETAAICPRCEREIQVAIFDSGLVVEDQTSPGYPSPPSPPVPLNPPDGVYLEIREPNPWSLLSETLRKSLAVDTTPGVPSHLEAACILCELGVGSTVHPGLVFSLLGSLLTMKGYPQHTTRYFHAWDILKCPFCDAEFVFADQWWGWKKKW